MPLFDQKTMDHFALGSDFSFSATRIGALGAAEYTLVGIAVDASPSVDPFKAREEACIAEIVKACRRSPRADNLMLRLSQFNAKVDEIHGFKPLLACNPADYQGTLKISGATAAFDAAKNQLTALLQYGRDLKAADLTVNAITFVITDGEDNVSKATTADVREALRQARREEALDSVLAVLVGVNVTDPSVSASLQRFRDEAGFDAYLEIDNADEAALARVAAFASRSIQAQSKALGTGATARVIGF
jgi:hypothetical protein